jgi:hypothetical protein
LTEKETKTNAQTFSGFRRNFDLFCKRKTKTIIIIIIKNEGFTGLARTRQFEKSFESDVSDREQTVLLLCLRSNETVSHPATQQITIENEQ